MEYAKVCMSIRMGNARYSCMTERHAPVVGDAGALGWILHAAKT
jgi:hypothetical protein